MCVCVCVCVCVCLFGIVFYSLVIDIFALNFIGMSVMICHAEYLFTRSFPLSKFIVFIEFVQSLYIY